MIADMWVSPETVSVIRGSNNARKAAEKLVEESGLGICLYCEEEIALNAALSVWESSSLLGFCDKAMNDGGKHKPVVKYSLEEGVVKVERIDG